MTTINGNAAVGRDPRTLPTKIVAEPSTLEKGATISTMKQSVETDARYKADQQAFAARDKLNGVLTLADLNQYRLEAGGEADLTEDDFVTIRESVGTVEQEHNAGLHTSNLRNEYMKFIAENFGLSD